MTDVLVRERHRQVCTDTQRRRPRGDRQSLGGRGRDPGLGQPPEAWGSLGSTLESPKEPALLTLGFQASAS